MTKHAALVCAVALCATLLLAETRPPGAVAQEAERPNVLLIITDDQREGLEVMPATSRLFVDGGRIYTNAFATTPQCCPSRASIFTGRYVHNHAVKNNALGRELDPQTILSYYLKSAGYRTALFGKYVNRWGGRPPPYFDRWVTLLGANRYRNAIYNVNGDYRDLRGYSTTVLGDRLIDFLWTSEAKADAQPWMVTFTPAAPHAPYLPEDRYRRAEVGKWHGNPAVYEYRTKEGKADKPHFLQGAARAPAKHVRKGQMRTLISVDDVVRRIFGTLAGLDERNTIAIFVSDNGLMWGEHGWVDKAVPHTFSVRVPLMMRWPGHVTPGSIDGRLAANVDIAPTILSAAGVMPEGATFDGRSLLDESWTRQSILLEFFGPEEERIVPPWASLRAPSYQYTEYYGDDGGIMFREYYDLARDPWQLHNLFGDDDPANDPADAAELHDRLTRARSCAGADCP
jgi:arylsulfatase A-like enzyme